MAAARQSEEYGRVSPEGAERGDVGTVPSTGGASRGHGPMTMKITCFAVAVLLAVGLSGATGQEGEEVLTNADVVKLTEADLPAALIVAKIAATRTDFDTSVDQLVALSAAGVDAGVIEAMMAAGSRNAAAPAGAAPPGGGDRVTPAPGADAPARSAGTVFRDCDGCPEMVVIPAGTFRMGCVSGRDCFDDEQPVHAVMMSQPFALSKHEVTFEEYDRFTFPNQVEDEGWGRGRRPVMNVSWDDAQEYVAWLSSETGARYRLPSEAEWEYAARAGTTTAYSWGNVVGNNRANCKECGSQWDDRMTVPVGSFGANAWGLHDMHGNVWEWVQDCWHASYVGVPRDGSAWTVGGNCGPRVLRGGSWSNGPRSLRAAYRGGITTDIRNVDFGFRVARTLD